MIDREGAKNTKNTNAKRPIFMEGRRMAIRRVFRHSRSNSFALFAPSRWMNSSSRSHAAAFTLIELLIVIGVIAILAGLLLGGYNVARRSSNTVFGKQQMQTLIAALHAYQQDFRDYPRNPFAMIDQPVTASPPDGYQPAPPRTDPTLAMALLGPGAANAVYGYANGDVDGSDGPGFKSQMSLYATYTVLNAASGATFFNLTGGPSFNLNSNTTGTLPFTAISLGGPGSPDALVPVKLAGGPSITLTRPLIGNYKNAPCALLAPAGRTWGPYIKADDFKVMYVETANQPASIQVYAPTPAGPPGLVTISGPYEVDYFHRLLRLPVLLDHWGGPILYFPSYNAYTGRMVNTTNPIATSAVLPGPLKTTSPVSVGPILGMPNSQYGKQLTVASPYQYGNCGNNSAIDATNTNTIASVFWSGPLGTPVLRAAGSPTLPAINTSTTPPSITPFSHGQIAALLYKLGDINGDNAIDTPTGQGAETFSLSDPFFLVSPGPDGVFTELYPGADATSATASPQKMITNGDDIYSFEQ